MRKMLSLCLVLALILSLCVNLSGCGGPSNSHGQENASSVSNGGDSGSSGGDDTVYTVKIAHVLSESDDVHLGFVALKDMLEERSGGRFQVEIYSNAALSSGDEESAELVSTNAIQMACVGCFSLANLNPKLAKFSILDLPYLFQTDDEYYAYLDSDIGQAMMNEVLETTGNVWATTSYIRSWGCLTMTKDPAYSPADVAGKNILTQSPTVFRETAASWGGNVATVAFSEAYTAMQQGAVDGHLRPINLSISQRFYEVQRSVTLLNQSALMDCTLISQSWFDSLPANLQEIFTTALAEYEVIMRDYGITRQAESVQQMADYGVTIIDLSPEEKQVWIDSSAVVYEKMADTIGQDVIDEARAFLEEYRAK